MKKIIVFFSLFIFAMWLAVSTDPVVGIIAGLSSSAIFTVFFEDGLNNLKTWLDIPIKTSQLTIFLYGRGGSGKTTFIKHILSLEDLRNMHQLSTEYVEYFKGALYYAPNPVGRIRRKYNVPIYIADYKGQAPKQALKLKRSFKSQINAIIFIVDIVHPDPKSEGNVMYNQALVEWLAYDTEEKINNRMIQHVAYIGDAILSIIFSDILSINKNQLRSVRLVINKIDIIEKLIAKGCLPNCLSSGLSAEEYVHKKFRPIEQYMRNACSQNHILDVDINVVSFTKGTGVRDLTKGLIKTHFQALRIR